MQDRLDDAFQAAEHGSALMKEGQYAAALSSLVFAIETFLALAASHPDPRVADLVRHECTGLILLAETASANLHDSRAISAGECSEKSPLESEGTGESSNEVETVCVPSSTAQTPMR